MLWVIDNRRVIHIFMSRLRVGGTEGETLAGFGQ